MGWTSYHATHYTKAGRIDRKAECDSYFNNEGINAGFYNIKRSALLGSVYYAAVEHLKRYAKNEDGTTKKDEQGRPLYEDIPENERETFAAVFLTSTDSRNYWDNFAYKDMDETCGPFEARCPLSIIALLSDTDNESAQEWRKRCREYAEKKKDPHALNNLEIGAVIRIEWQGQPVELVKHAPAYQFKRPFWYDPKNNTYMQARRIPAAYEIVTA